MARNAQFLPLLPHDLDSRHADLFIVTNPAGGSALEGPPPEISQTDWTDFQISNAIR